MYIVFNYDRQQTMKIFLKEDVVSCTQCTRLCYDVHRAGVKTMARAFISHPGSSGKSSMQNVERGHKECTQVRQAPLVRQFRGVLQWIVLVGCTVQQWATRFEASLAQITSVIDVCLHVYHAWLCRAVNASEIICLILRYTVYTINCCCVPVFMIFCYLLYVKNVCFTSISQGCQSFVNCLEDFLSLAETALHCTAKHCQRQNCAQ